MNRPKDLVFYDMLSEVLGTVRLQSAVIGCAELSAPWGLRVHGWDDLAFYLIVRGSCQVDIDASGVSSLTSGDLLLVGPGLPHVIRDRARSPTIPFEALAGSSRATGGVVRHGGSGAATTLICGCFSLDPLGASLILGSLPSVAHFPAEAATPGFSLALQALVGEVADAQPGSQALLNRLADALFIQVLRACVRQGNVGAGWLRALGHPPLARALGAMHHNLAAPWTLSTLSQYAGMSRSAFAAQFHLWVGKTPLQHLTEWRMWRAAALLAAGASNLGEVAAQVGYGSDESFGRAFKQWAGVPPGAYRRHARTDPTKAPGGVC